MVATVDQIRSNFKGNSMSELRTHIDFESRSLVDLIKLGEHAYARHWSTTPLMLTIGTAPRGERPTFHTIDFFAIPGYADAHYPAIPEGTYPTFKVPCPPAILEAIRRGDTFVAHNARFEQAIYYYICHGRWGWPMPDRWSCTAARSRYYGLRASLDGSASDLEVISQKDARGKQFINDFCKPRKYVGPKKDGIVKELWYEPHQNPAGWQAGIEYCTTDGMAEADIDAVLPDLPPFEQAAWEWDFLINTRGVPIDLQSVGRAIAYSNHFTHEAERRFEEITSLRPTQRDRVLEYLQQREEITDLGDLRSKTLKRMVMSDFPEDLRDVIQIRLDCALASVKKLQTMERVADPADGRARGGHLYGGAHTMRWSHKRIQTGNMKRGDADTQARMFDYLQGNHWAAGSTPDLFSGPLDAREVLPWVDAAEWRFMRPLAALSVSMRGFIQAPPGHEIVTADFSQIEARVLAWLARCMWLLDAFRNKQDPYVKFGAEYMYNRPYEDCFEYKNGKRYVVESFKRQRQIAKSAVLGAGFGLGKAKFVEYCDNSDLIITEAEADRTISAYRAAHPEIVQFWARVENAACSATLNPGHRYTLGGTGVSFYTWHIDTERYWLVCELPSGRCIHYYRPKIQFVERFGQLKEQLTFRTEWVGRSYREATYGGKLCIAEGTDVLTERGWVPIQHVLPSDFVWDGKNWTTHGGLVCKGFKEVGQFFGVWMTPDHEVLTEKGWVRASQSEGLNRHKVRLPSRYRAHKQRMALQQGQLQVGDVGGTDEQQAFVFDLLNCGPLARFTVRGADGEPLIVHNCENIVQAIARDILVVGGLNAEREGYPSIMLVHDENVTLPLKGHGDAATLCNLMCQQEAWVTDLPIEAEGAVMERYGK